MRESLLGRRGGRGELFALGHSIGYRFVMGQRRLVGRYRPRCDRL